VRWMKMKTVWWNLSEGTLDIDLVDRRHIKYQSS
jgi:hypothetical protein